MPNLQKVRLELSGDSWSNTLGALQDDAAAGIQTLLDAPDRVAPFLKDIDVTSALFGCGAALALFVFFRLMRSAGRILAKMGVVALAVGLIASAYLGWVRKEAGLSTDVLATPKMLVDDARRVKDQALERFERQERAIQELEGH